MRKKPPTKKDVARELTLDEYDELTMEHQIKGASLERANMIAELERKARQLREFSEVAELVRDHDQFAQHARGMEMAARILKGVRVYEENVGCPECEAF
jgi:hypothetical protein